MLYGVLLECFSLVWLFSLIKGFWINWISGTNVKAYQISTICRNLDEVGSEDESNGGERGHNVDTSSAEKVK